MFRGRGISLNTTTTSHTSDNKDKNESVAISTPTRKKSLFRHHIVVSRERNMGVVVSESTALIGNDAIVTTAVARKAFEGQDAEASR